MIGLLLAVLVIAGVGVLLGRVVKDTRLHAAIMVAVVIAAFGAVLLLRA